MNAREIQITIVLATHDVSSTGRHGRFSFRVLVGARELLAGSGDRYPAQDALQATMPAVLEDGIAGLFDPGVG